MSATRDKNQKITFVYSNLYQMYRKGKEAATNAELPAEATAGATAIHHADLRGVETAKILKADDGARAEIAVKDFRPAELLAKRIARPEVLRPALQAAPAQAEALSSLKDNLKALNDLHSRLRFMLKELEELTKE